MKLLSFASKVVKFVFETKSVMKVLSFASSNTSIVNWVFPPTSEAVSKLVRLIVDRWVTPTPWFSIVVYPLPGTEEDHAGRPAETVRICPGVPIGRAVKNPDESR